MAALRDPTVSAVVPDLVCRACSAVRDVDLAREAPPLAAVASTPHARLRLLPPDEADAAEADAAAAAAARLAALRKQLARVDADLPRTRARADALREDVRALRAAHARRVRVAARRS
jgi:hypothetical protein